MAFRFKLRVASEDSTGYYYTRWDKATPVTVVADNQNEAYEKTWALMGENPRSGFDWTAIIDSAEEITNE